LLARAVVGELVLVHLVDEDGAAGQVDAEFEATLAVLVRHGGVGDDQRRQPDRQQADHEPPEELFEHDVRVSFPSTQYSVLSTGDYLAAFFAASALAAASSCVMFR